MEATGAAAAPAGVKRRRDHTPLMAPGPGRPSVGVALSIIGDAEQWSHAQDEFEDALLALGSAGRIASQIRTSTRLVEAALHVPLFPLDGEKLLALSSALRAARYRSGAAYLKTVRAEHVARDLPWPGSLARLYHRCCSAIERGKGPPTRAGLADVLERGDRWSGWGAPLVAHWPRVLGH